MKYLLAFCCIVTASILLRIISEHFIHIPDYLVGFWSAIVYYSFLYYYDKKNDKTQTL